MNKDLISISFFIILLFLLSIIDSCNIYLVKRDLKEHVNTHSQEDYRIQEGR